MVQVIWTTPAQQDMAELFRHYDALSHKTAAHYMEEFLEAAVNLTQMPEAGPKEPMLAHHKRNYRYLVVLRRYKLIYLYENSTCFILMIWDCRRNPKTLKTDNRF
jgi:plasmid stabilization system protein ParE